MNYETDTPFNLEKIRLEGLNRKIKRALTEFEENPKICWTQLPMEKPLWLTLQLALGKQISYKVDKKHKAIDGIIYGSCKCEIEYAYYYKYCSNCGQKLDWD